MTPTIKNSRYYGIVDVLLVPAQKNNFSVLTLDKADTMNFSYNIIMKNYCLLFIICQNTLQKTSGMFLFTSVPSGPFPFRFFGREQLSPYPRFPMTA